MSGALVLGGTAKVAEMPQLSPEQRLVELSRPAYQIAVRALGGAGSAEDVVQGAYLRALVQLRAGFSPGNERAWFLKVVANVARNHLRDEAARKRREKAVESTSAEAALRAGPDGELVSCLRTSMESLDVKHRLPLALCYEQGLSQRDAAEILDLPRTTLAEHLDEGLRLLRKNLARAGYAAAPAAVAGALAHTAPEVPAGLTAAIGKLVVTGGGTVLRPAPATGTMARLRQGHGGQASASKGGLIVKIGLGIAAAGALAGGAAIFAKPSTLHLPPPTPLAAPAATEEKPKFPIPVWHPDARWEQDPKPYVASFPGELAGPRQETMWWHAWGSAPTQFPGMTQGSREVCYTYDLPTERYYPMAGSTMGWLDGPFSRARLGGADYTTRPRAVLSPDGRYGYMNDVRNGGKLRFFDFEKQEVKTFFPDQRFGGSMVVNSKGELLTIRKDGMLLVIGPDGSLIRQGPKFQMDVSIGGMGDGGATLALDEAKNRIYASAMDRSWYYWYWDLTDGTLHGVIPVPKKGEPTRNRTGIALPIPGPFKGTALYGEGTALIFGPDDPGRRFLYSTRVDTSFIFRLDLEKEIVSIFCAKEGRFLESGKPSSGSCAGIASPVWLPDGSYLGAEGNYRWYLFKRVK